MKRIFSALAVALCVVLSAMANDELNVKSSDAHIYGHVIDKETGEHLPYVFVLL